jgi:predicted nucleic acid-binding protein
VARIVLLDAGPLGLLCTPPGVHAADQCRAWLQALAAAGVDVLVPAVADYEVRRELIRAGAAAKLQALDGLGLPILELVRATWLRAAEFWALVRRQGLPTAAAPALDADCLIAAGAAVLASGGDAVTVATTNVGHLGRFPAVDARPWATIT